MDKKISKKIAQQVTREYKKVAGGGYKRKTPENEEEVIPTQNACECVRVSLSWNEWQYEWDKGRQGGGIDPNTTGKKMN